MILPHLVVLCQSCWYICLSPDRSGWSPPGRFQCLGPSTAPVSLFMSYLDQPNTSLHAQYIVFTRPRAPVRNAELFLSLLFHTSVRSEAGSNADPTSPLDLISTFPSSDHSKAKITGASGAQVSGTWTVRTGRRTCVGHLLSVYDANWAWSDVRFVAALGVACLERWTERGGRVAVV